MRRFAPLLVVLLGAWLRFHALVQDIRFQPDEAWFSTFARAAALNGDWWLRGPLDKPPLAIYANALAQVFIGDSEFAARVPGTFAGILLLPVMFAAAQAWYGAPRRVPLSLTVLILAALSPYAIAFSATAYTDTPMLLGLGLALALAGRSQWGWSGVWLGLAFACKQQALFYLPLLLMLGWSAGELTVRRTLRFLAGLLAVTLALMLWDTARPGDSLFLLAAINNDPGRLIRSAEILPRLQTWLHYGQALLGPGWLTALLVLVALAGTAARIRQEPRQRCTLVDCVLLTFVLGYGLLHWLVALNTYDRYLLPLLPPLLLLAGRGLDWPGARVSDSRRLPLQRGIVAALMIALIVPAIRAAEGDRIVNTGYRQYMGIDSLAAYLNEQPVAAVIYDRWLGWELRYYLGQWHNKRMIYYPTPDLLVRDALALCEIGPRYFPAPADQPAGPWLEALQKAGFQISQTYTSPNFVVYQLIPPWTSMAACDSQEEGTRRRPVLSTSVTTVVRLFARYGLVR